MRKNNNRTDGIFIYNNKIRNEWGNDGDKQQ